MAWRRTKREFPFNNGLADSKDSSKFEIAELTQAENISFVEQDSIEMTRSFGRVQNYTNEGVIAIRRAAKRAFAFSPQKVYSIESDYELKELGSFLNCDITSEVFHQSYTDAIWPDIVLDGSLCHLVFEQDNHVFHTVFDITRNFITQTPVQVSENNIGGSRPRVLSHNNLVSIVHIDQSGTNIYLLEQETQGGDFRREKLIQSVAGKIVDLNVSNNDGILEVQYQVNLSDVITNYKFQYSLDSDSIIDGSNVENTDPSYGDIKTNTTIEDYGTLHRMNKWCEFEFNNETYLVFWNEFRGYFITDSLGNIVGKFLGKISPSINKFGVEFRGAPQIVETDEQVTIYIPGLKQSLQVQQDQDTIVNPIGINLVKIEIGKTKLLSEVASTKNVTAVGGGIISQVDSEDLLELGFCEAPLLTHVTGQTDILKVEDISATAEAGTGNRIVDVNIDSSEIDETGLKVQKVIDKDHTLNTLEKVGAGSFGTPTSFDRDTSDTHEVLDVALNSNRSFSLEFDRDNSYRVSVFNRSNNSLVENISLDRLGLPDNPDTTEEQTTTTTTTVSNLYMIGDRNDALYTVDTTTGRATRVGNSNRFGVGETAPSGLASIGNTLYMAGLGNDRIYILNPQTGVAASVVSVSDPIELFSDGSTLYTVRSLGSGSNYEEAIFRIDLQTGATTRVGNAFRFGLDLVWPQGFAFIGNTLYMVDAPSSPNINKALYTVNLTTGVATQVGTATNFGVNERPHGLAYHNGILYMAGDFENALYTLSTQTGVATRVGSSNSFGVSESRPTALASFTETTTQTSTITVAVPGAPNTSNLTYISVSATNNDVYLTGKFTDFDSNEQRKLYKYSLSSRSKTNEWSLPAEQLVSTDNNFLYLTNKSVSVGDNTINKRTLNYSPVSTETFSATNALNLTSLSRYGSKYFATSGDESTVQSDSFYAVSRGTRGLYTINSNTLQATAIGSLGIFSPRSIATHDGTLYLVKGSVGGEDLDVIGLYTVNLTTGEASKVGNPSDGFGVNELNPVGLASDGTNLFMTGNSAGTNLYTLNTTTGVATSVGTAGANMELAYSNGVLYGIGGPATALYTINTTTGAATRVGTATNFGLSFNPSVVGASAVNGTVYFNSLYSNALYTLNTTTGVATRVGTPITPLVSGGGLRSINLRVFPTEQIYRYLSTNKQGSNLFLDDTNVYSITFFTSAHVSQTLRNRFRITYLKSVLAGKTISSVTIGGTVYSNIETADVTIGADTYTNIDALNVPNTQFPSGNYNSPPVVLTHTQNIDVNFSDDTHLWGDNDGFGIGLTGIFGIDGFESTSHSVANDRLYEIDSSSISTSSVLDSSNDRPIGLGNYQDSLVVLNDEDTNVLPKIFEYDETFTSLRVGVFSKTGTVIDRTAFDRIQLSQGTTSLFDQSVDATDPTSSTSGATRFYDIPLTTALQSTDYTLQVEFNEALPSNKWVTGDICHPFTYQDKPYKVLKIEALNRTNKTILNVTFESVPSGTPPFYIQLDDIGSSDASQFTYTSNNGKILTFTSVQSDVDVGFTSGVNEVFDFEVISGSSPPSQTPATTTGQTVTYFAVYKWIDSNGKSQYSKISNLQTVTIADSKIGVGSNPTTVPLEVSFLNLTNKKDVLVQIYRSTFVFSTLQASTFKKVGELTNDQSSEKIIYTDSTRDADLKERFFLFGRDQPNAGSSIIEHQNRIIIADGTNLYFSEEPVFEREEAISFRIDAVQIFPSDIRAIASLDNQIAVITEKGIHSVVIGATGLTVNKIHSLENLKIVKNSIVAFQHGLFFQTNYGVTLLDRGLRLTYVGDNVKKHLANHNVIDGFVNEARQECVLRLSDGNVNLVYNYLYNKWSAIEQSITGELDFPSGETLRLDNNARLLSSISDNKLPVTSIVETGDIDVSGGIQGFNRLLALYFLGEWKNFDSIKIDVFKDHLDSIEASVTVNRQDIMESLELGEDDVPYGEGEFASQHPIHTHFEVPMRLGRMSSFRMRFTITSSQVSKLSSVGALSLTETDRFFKEREKFPAVRA